MTKCRSKDKSNIQDRRRQKSSSNWSTTSVEVFACYSAACRPPGKNGGTGGSLPTGRNRYPGNDSGTKGSPRSSRVIDYDGVVESVRSLYKNVLSTANELQQVRNFADKKYTGKAREIAEDTINGLREAADAVRHGQSHDSESDDSDLADFVDAVRKKTPVGGAETNDDRKALKDRKSKADRAYAKALNDHLERHGMSEYKEAKYLATRARDTMMYGDEIGDDFKRYNPTNDTDE